VSVCPSVCLSAATGRIFTKFDIWAFLENLSAKCKFDYSLRRMAGTSHEDRRTYITISRWNLLRIRNVSEPFYVPKLVFLNLCRLWDNLETTWRIQTGHRWQCNTAQKRYKNTDTLILFNNNCYSTAIMVTRTRLGVTFYLQSVSSSWCLLLRGLKNTLMVASLSPSPPVSFWLLALQTRTFIHMTDARTGSLTHNWNATW
jgi:hypothetical protein